MGDTDRERESVCERVDFCSFLSGTIWPNGMDWMDAYKLVLFWISANNYAFVVVMIRTHCELRIRD